MEELDSIKTEIFNEFQDKNSEVFKRFDEISNHIYQINDSRQDDKLSRIALEQYTIFFCF